MNRDVLKIVRRLDEMIERASMEYKGTKSAFSFEKLQTLWSASDVARSVFFDSINPDRLPPLPRMKMDDLPDANDTSETFAEWHARMSEKYPSKWRLEFHDEMGLHWNLNDEDPPNTFGVRTVIECGDEELDEVDERATAVGDELMKVKGKVEYLDFYQAMNA